MTYYIQRKDGRELETVDEFSTYKEAHSMVGEYRISDSSADYYISQRACKAWGGYSMTHRNALGQANKRQGILAPSPSCDRCTVPHSERNSRGSVLVQGKIPAHTPCPFANVCHEKRNGWCNHRGEAHRVPYSCGYARLFDIVQQGNNA